MSWDYSFDSRALKELKKLDFQIQKRIISYLDKHIQRKENPRHVGKGLKASLAGLWRYRVGNYRIICQIQESHLLVLVIAVGHRKNIYL